MGQRYLLSIWHRKPLNFLYCNFWIYPCLWLLKTDSTACLPCYLGILGILILLELEAREDVIGWGISSELVRKIQNCFKVLNDVGQTDFPGLLWDSLKNTAVPKSILPYLKKLNSAGYDYYLDFLAGNPHIRKWVCNDKPLYCCMKITWTNQRSHQVQAGFQEYKKPGDFSLNCEIKRKGKSGDKERLVSNAYDTCWRLSKITK